MSDFDVQIRVEERMSDETLAEQFEEFLAQKFMDVYFCQQCNEVFRDPDGIADCPRCESHDTVRFSEVGPVVTQL